MRTHPAIEWFLAALAVVILVALGGCGEVTAAAPGGDAGATETDGGARGGALGTAGAGTAGAGGAPSTGQAGSNGGGPGGGPSAGGQTERGGAGGGPSCTTTVIQVSADLVDGATGKPIAFQDIGVLVVEFQAQSTTASANTIAGASTASTSVTVKPIGSGAGIEVEASMVGPNGKRLGTTPMGVTYPACDGSTSLAFTFRFGGWPQ